MDLGESTSRSVLGVHGAPAFIVRAALYGAFGAPPDLVLSGINRGPNTGKAVLHSGTVGAALTAATFGRRALAISAELSDPPDWAAASEVAHWAIDWLVDAPDPTVLNVNVPALPPKDLKGACPARLAFVGTVQANVTDVDRGFVPVTFSDVDPTPQPGTDAALLADGYVPVTALRPVCEEDDLPLQKLIAEHVVR
jgi:5'-nucleotidase